MTASSTDDPTSGGEPRNAPPASLRGTPADRAAILLETARQLGSSLEPAAIFARLVHSVRSAMACDGLLVSSFDRADRTIRCVFAWVEGNVLDHTTLPPLHFREDGGGMQSQVIRTGHPTRFSNVAERVRDPKGRYFEISREGGVRDLKQEPEPPKCHSAIMVPLRLEDEVVGVVQVMTDADTAYSEADLELVEGISLLLAVALENARLYRRAQDELEERRNTERVLREAEEALREADRRKDEFLATLGHELRNPLGPIRSAGELLRQKDVSAAEVTWAHEVILRQVTHLARLIDDLLDVGRITQGKLELRRAPIELNDLVKGAVESIRPAIEALGQRIELHASSDAIALNADPVRLAQVFTNLLDNASKYAQKNGRIDVHVARDATGVTVSVRDDGAGISPQHLDHVFDPFYQADPPPGQVRGGLGIGLTLVKRLVEMHGGTIDVSSAASGGGTEFVVRMPAHDTTQVVRPAPAARMASAVRTRRILVADDNRDSADAMAMLLRLCGNEVRTAYDGEEALSVAAGFRPEVLVLDIGMPRVSGYEVARRLRSESWTRNVVMIAATGWGQEADRRRSLETGFDAHLVKPVDHLALLRLMGDLVSRRSRT